MSCRALLLPLALVWACGSDPALDMPDAAVAPAEAPAISEGPAEVTMARSATFAFAAAGGGGAAFQCSVDGAPYAGCVSPHTVSVAEGDHRFAVRAGANGIPATLAWRVDLTAPKTTIATGPSAMMAMSEAAFTFAASETATFECALDDLPAAVCESGVRFSELGLGAHALRVRAVDVAANREPMPALWQWTVTSLTPNTIITAKPDTPWRVDAVDFQFASNVAGARFECRLNDEPPLDCVSPRHYDLTEGSWTFQVTAIDEDGRRDPTPASTFFTIRYVFW